MRAIWIALVMLAGCVDAPVSMGRADYERFCVSCHGVDGRGDGLVAGGLGAAPPDLTQIAAANGGVFPLVEVMSTIDGYTRRVQHGAQLMPEFGPVIQSGDLVLVETEPGVRTPTPERLLALARYIETLQD